MANLVLDVADELGESTTNLALNKITYFLHGIYLAKFGRPLVDAKIEAWEFGPVFREVYHEFKDFKNKAVTRRATRMNFETQVRTAFEVDLGADELELLRHYARLYLKIEPRKLVDMSHVEDGPWHDAWYHDGTVNPGMQISDDAILAHFSKAVRH